MFHGLVEALREELPDFGQHLAADSKGIQSHGRPRGKEAHQNLAQKALEEGPDRRRDLDADFGVKTYKGKREDGTKWKSVVKWFGYKLHLIMMLAMALGRVRQNSSKGAGGEDRTAPTIRSLVGAT
ncbi:MAG: hypothetical protein ACLFWL_06975 [Candidatus Brocadiia bacterium]